MTPIVFVSTCLSALGALLSVSRPVVVFVMCLAAYRAPATGPVMPPEQTTEIHRVSLLLAEQCY